jgi:beta-1,4-mannosyl-glycoprotein beta-1,4-N-acetylglucosaminyltransferase
MIVEIVWSFNLIDITWLRINSLKDYINKWIIVEYPFDYARKSRPLYFNENKERFKEFEDKIIHIIDDDDYNGASGLGLLWDRKKSPKVHNALSFLQPDDFLIVSDEDALISEHTMKVIQKDIFKIYSVCMFWSLWQWNRITPDAVFNWSQTAPFKYFDKNLVVNAPNVSVTYLGYDELQNPAGWHLAKCGGIESAIANMSGHPHQDLATIPTILDKDKVEERMSKGFGWTDASMGVAGKDWYWPVQPINLADFPLFVAQNVDIYKKYFNYERGIINDMGYDGWK